MKNFIIISSLILLVLGFLGCNQDVESKVENTEDVTKIRTSYQRIDYSIKI